MDEILCDELLLEILRRLSPPSKPAAALVSKRWLSLLRAATLSLRLPLSLSSLPPLPSLLSLYPSLSSLTLLSPNFPPSLFLSLSYATNLRHVGLLSSPVSPLSLSSFPLRQLASLHVSGLVPVSFHWLPLFPSLKSLSVVDCSDMSSDDDSDDGADDGNIGLEFLSLGGIRGGERRLSWLWRNCGRIRRLQLRGCEGIGDPTARFFSSAITNLEELEMRTCRAIVDEVLILAAHHCRSLNKLVLYDGGSRSGLRYFTRHINAESLQSLDLRLPLDLDNSHITAMGERFRALTCLRLQSCCLVSGEGLRSLANSSIEDLGLVNCDVLERERGLLSFLGQSLKRLKKIDLSHNELLMDKELGAMLASCGNLVEIRLKGCKGISDASMVSLFRCCSVIEVVDVERCNGVSDKGVEVLVLGALRLRRVYVEEEKLSEKVLDWVSRKMIQVL